MKLFIQRKWKEKLNINPLIAAKQKSRYWRKMWMNILFFLLVLLIWIWLQQQKGEDERKTGIHVSEEVPEAKVPSKVPTPEPTELDDLKKLKGIGPKIAKVLHNAGIRTFDQLASTKIEQLEQILQDAGIRLANSSTWPEQASFAAAGDWDGLEKLQSQI